MKESNHRVNVFLWGIQIGTLSWDPQANRPVFSFSEEYLDAHFDISPSVYSKERKRNQSFYGDKAFEGLPSFLADSLPDDWGNTLFDKWTSENHIPLNDMRALYKLSFIGKRGMGALEFVPSFEVECPEETVVLESLYETAMMVLHDRENVHAAISDNLTLQQLIALGTSAGGKHAKGVIAMNSENDIRSGQVSLPPEYRYYLLKFNEDPEVPACEVEKVFYEMAIDSGIDMMPSRLLPIAGKNHFLTERFDRLPGGEKIHVQSLRALNPRADDYMNLFWLCDKLCVPDSQKKELFRRMVFNFLAGVSDDHNRNFSFLMDREGRWSLSPAYDEMFTSNTWINPAAFQHSLGMWQKRSHITVEDFVDFGEDIGIQNCRQIVHDISDSVSTFPSRCKNAGIDGRWVDMIWGVIKTLIPSGS